MFSNPIRIAAGVLGLVAAVALVAAIAAGAKAFDRMKADAAAYQDCRAIAGDVRGVPSDPPRCAPAIGQALATAAAAKACDLALERGVAPLACSAPVKHVLADRDAKAGEVADRDQLVDQLKAERSADVARAEVRGRTQARRTADATRTLDAAPRDDRGRIACDADCLSVLAGDVP